MADQNHNLPMDKHIVIWRYESTRNVLQDELTTEQSEVVRNAEREWMKKRDTSVKVIVY